MREQWASGSHQSGRWQGLILHVDDRGMDYPLLGSLKRRPVNLKWWWKA